MMKLTNSTVGYLVLALSLGISGCHTGSKLQWAGTWQSNEPGHNGDVGQLASG